MPSTVKGLSEGTFNFVGKYFGMGSSYGVGVYAFSGLQPETITKPTDKSSRKNEIR